MSVETTRSGHAQVLRELNEERAAALSRIARRLDTLLAGLCELRTQAEQASEKGRAELWARYDLQRTEALKHRWYLEVQRESIGIRSHRLLDELYPVPGRLP